MARRRGLRWVLGICVVLAAALTGTWFYLGRAVPEYQPYAYGRTERAKLPRLTLLNHNQLMHEVLGHPPMEIKRIGILVYDGADTLEVIAPMAVFSELMNVQLEYIALQPGVVRTGLADLQVERGIASADALDVLLVPGGTPEAIDLALTHGGLREWLQRVDSGTQMTAGIGLGTVLLADAGLMAERSIAFASPNAAENALALGAQHAAGRYVQDGKYWTSLPSTAALDLSLAMLRVIAGDRHLQAAMLDLEYDPAPPFDLDSPETDAAQTPQSQAAHSLEWRGLRLLDMHRGSGDPQQAPLEVGLLVYPDFFTLDAIGPLSVLSQLRHARVRLLRWGNEPVIKSGRTRLQVPMDARQIDHLDVLLVPGGANGTWTVLQDATALDWIRRIDARSTYTTSVCTGSWVLGAAGLLKDKRATSNWYRMRQMLPRWGALPVAERYVQDGKYWTSAGVSAGIDLGFALIAQIDGAPQARGDAAIALPPRTAHQWRITRENRRSGARHDAPDVRLPHGAADSQPGLSRPKIALQHR